MTGMNRGGKRFHWLPLLAGDCLAIAGAYYTTLFLRFHSVWGHRFFTWINRRLEVRPTAELSREFMLFYYTSAPRIIPLMMLSICLLYALRDLYGQRRFLRPRPVAWNLVLANLTALVLFYVYFYLSRNVFHPRSMFGTMLAINVLYSVGLRAALREAAAWAWRRHGVNRICAVLIGENRSAALMHDLIDVTHPHGLDIATWIRRGDVSPAEMETACRGAGADMLICALDSLPVETVMEVLEIGERLRIPVKILSPQLDVVASRGNMPVDYFHGAPLVHFDAPGVAWSERKLRPGLTRLAGGLCLLALSPVMGLIALAIRLGGRGGVFFVQERIGVNREAFSMMKFRTMHNRAEELQAQVEEFNESGGGLFKMRRDPRVTLVGRMLRRFSLDELPQLWNVVRGDMVFVGPRPLPRRDFENYYEEWHYGRHAGMPGLTCLWQVSGRSDLDFHSMCLLDIYYLRNWDWVLDVKILLRTVWVVCFGKGAY